MFSDRGWILKAAVALGLLAWVCTESRRRIRVQHPEVEHVAVYSDSLRDKTIHLWGKRVLSTDPGGFQVPSYVGPIRVVSSHPVAVGEHVSVIARPVGPRTVEAIRLQINEGFEWKRPLNYIVSILTLIGYLWIIRRRFRWRIEDGAFRSKY